MKTIATYISLLLILFSCSKPEEFIFEYKQGESVAIKQHPRLLFTPEEEEKMLEMAENEPLLAELISVLREEADEILTKPLQQPDDNGAANLGKSREQVYRFVNLSLAYRLFEEDIYAERVEEELLNVCDFKSWHPEHFLDVAELTAAVAIGYDWCYDKLSAETRKTVENAILEKAFAPAWPVYENGNEGSWAKRNTNWNVVCNSGLVAGALAIADKHPQETARIINYAAQFTPNNIEHFAPNGVYYEGPAYWGYTNIYLALLLDNFQHVLKTDFGLSAMEGVSKTAEYYIKTTSPARQVFNFADAHGAEASLLPIYFFYSKNFNQPEVAAFYRSYLQETLDSYKANGEANFPRYFFLAIPWFDDAKFSGNESTPKLQVFEGEPDMLVFNGNKSDKDELFLIAKGGDPDMAHNQLDVGAFVVESQDIRWGIDLGSENYGLPHFWDYKPDGVRWTYFRNNNLAHNTLNIDGEIANSRGDGKLSQFHLSDEQPFGILNISSSYSDQADSVMRGFKMMAPDMILVRDEVKLKPEAKLVNWRFFTEAQVNVKDNIIELEQDGKKFYLKTFPEENTKIQVKDAKPNSPEENPIEGVKFIEVSASPAKGNFVSISVLMSSNLSALESMSASSLTLMKQW